MINTDPNAIRSFHAHIYYSLNQKSVASAIRDDFSSLLSKELPDSNLKFADVMSVGAMHDGPIGPHTKPMFTVPFAGRALRHVVNHLMIHRNGLDVLIHPQTDNDLRDHTSSAMWIGNPVVLDVSKL